MTHWWDFTASSVGVVCGKVFSQTNLPGHKSCMVLTHSMATTNNVQGDEPLRSTALERQVQTLITAVERLTKQNHNLEEQLHQRDVGHNIQEDNQENSSEQGEPERPEGGNTPSRPERQNLSLPSLMDTTPPPIIAEM